jgi:hypothetical protein
MKILGDFLRGLDFVRLRPDASIIAGGVPARHRAYALSEPGRAWAIYLARDTKDSPAPTGPQVATIELKLPAGAFLVQWVDPRTGRVTESPLEWEVKSAGAAKVVSPTFEEDVALAIRRLNR